MIDPISRLAGIVDSFVVDRPVYELRFILVIFNHSRQSSRKFWNLVDITIGNGLKNAVEATNRSLDAQIDLVTSTYV